MLHDTFHLRGQSLGQHGLGEVRSRSRSTNIGSLGRSLSNDVVHALGDNVGLVLQSKVTEEHGSRQQKSSGVSLVLAHDVLSDVTASGLKEGVLAAKVASWDDTGSTDERGTNVGDDVSVQVGEDDDVKLLGTRNELHGGVVDDHLVKLDAGVAILLLCDALAGVEEETVTELHDVGLVDTGDLLAVVLDGKVESETGNALGLGTGGDLERLYDTGVGLVLETRVLSLGVFTDDGKVDVLVAGGETWEGLADNNRRVDVEGLTHGDVPRVVACLLHGGEENTLESDLVALQGLHSLLESSLVTASLARYVVLLPLDGDLEGLENLLDRVGDLVSDTITGDEGNSVLATKLGGQLKVSHGSAVCGRRRFIPSQLSTHPALLSDGGHRPGDEGCALYIEIVIISEEVGKRSVWCEETRSALYQICLVALGLALAVEWLRWLFYSPWRQRQSGVRRTQKRGVIQRAL